MPVTVNWGTKVISVTQSFLTPLGGTSYSLDTNAFRFALRDLEDDEAGVPFLPTHNHNTVVLLGGIQYARIIEMINGYTITFENVGVPYKVFLTGSNNNILDVTNLNNVSVAPNNSAGLINVAEVQQIIFNEEVHLDVDNGAPGTLYPKGTPLDPVNNLTDALAIAASRGMDTIRLLSDLTIMTGMDISNIRLRSDTWPGITLQAGVLMQNTIFQQVSLYGVFGGIWNTLVDCWVYDITNFSGLVRGGSIGEVSLSASLGGEFVGQSFFDSLVPLYPNSTSIITANTNVEVSLTNCADSVMLTSLTSGGIVKIGLSGGSFIVDSTCTGGNITVTGMGRLSNNSTGTTFVDGSALQDGTRVPKTVGYVSIEASSPYSGTQYPNGSTDYPVNNLIDALAIAARDDLTVLRIHGALTTAGSENLTNIVVNGTTAIHDMLTLTTGTITQGTVFQNLHINGVFNGNNSVLERCLIGNVTNFNSYCYQSFFYGTVSFSGPTTISLCSIAPIAVAQTVTFNFNNNPYTVVVDNWGAGRFKVQNMITNSFLGIAGTGRVVIDVANTGGTIVYAGGMLIDDTYAATIDTLTDSSIAGNVWTIEKGGDLHAASFNRRSNVNNVITIYEADATTIRKQFTTNNDISEIIPI